IPLKRRQTNGIHPISELAAGMVALAGRLEPREADRRCTGAADVIVRALNTPMDDPLRLVLSTDDMQQLGESLGAVATYLEPSQAARCCAAAADRLERWIRPGGHLSSSSIAKISAGLAAVADRLEPDETQRIILGIVNTMMSLDPRESVHPGEA